MSSGPCISQKNVVMTGFCFLIAIKFLFVVLDDLMTIFVPPWIFFFFFFGY